jgi:hypothetical protein
MILSAETQSHKVQTSAIRLPYQLQGFDVVFYWILVALILL